MINTAPDYYSEGSSERRIQEVLVPLVKEMKELIFTDEFKKSPEFNSEDTELDVLGIIVSKYCEWVGKRIETVAISAFEDSNYSDVSINY